LSDGGIISERNIRVQKLIDELEVQYAISLDRGGLNTFREKEVPIGLIENG
jgi:hypothetical protein